MMRPLVLIPLLLAATAAPGATAPAAEGPPDADILCSDGSRMKGSVEAIEKDHIRFGSPMLFQPARLKLKHVLELGLPGRQGDTEGDHLASLTLTNGDVMRGELTRLDDESVGLRTWYAGEMVFRRSMVDTLEIQDRPERIYQGPSELAGWTQSSEGAWNYEHGYLISSGQGSIARKLNLPVRTRFAFDLSWRSNPNFHFVFYSSDATTDNPDAGYDLICQRSRYVYLSKRTTRNGHSEPVRIGEYANLPELANKEKARFELLVNRQTGAIRLMVNGHVAADWTDPDPVRDGLGGCMHFVSEDSSPLRVSRIEVTSWDGEIEPVAVDNGMMIDEDEEENPKPPAEEPATNRIKLRNNDEVEGKALGVRDGKVKLATSFGEIEIPVSRLRTFTLHNPEERKDYTLGKFEIPKAYNGDVRAWFADGSRVTFRLDAAAAGKFTGFAQAFGQASFDATAFQRIEFNIWEPELEEMRKSDW